MSQPLSAQFGCPRDSSSADKGIEWCGSHRFLREVWQRWSEVVQTVAKFVIYLGTAKENVVAMFFMSSEHVEARVSSSTGRCLNQTYQYGDIALPPVAQIFL